jgi:hypothetical protein
MALVGHFSHVSMNMQLQTLLLELCLFSVVKHMHNKRFKTLTKASLNIAKIT